MAKRKSAEERYKSMKRLREEAAREDKQIAAKREQYWQERATSKKKVVKKRPSKASPKKKVVKKAATAETTTTRKKRPSKASPKKQMVSRARAMRLLKRAGITGVVISAGGIAAATLAKMLKKGPSPEQRSREGRAQQEQNVDAASRHKKQPKGKAPIDKVKRVVKKLRDMERRAAAESKGGRIVTDLKNIPKTEVPKGKKKRMSVGKPADPYAGKKKKRMSVGKPADPYAGKKKAGKRKLPRKVVKPTPPRTRPRATAKILTTGIKRFRNLHADRQRALRSGRQAYSSWYAKYGARLLREGDALKKQMTRAEWRKLESGLDKMYGSKKAPSRTPRVKGFVDTGREDRMKLTEPKGKVKRMRRKRR